MALGSRIGLGVNIDADDRWVDLVLRDLVFVVGASWLWRCGRGVGRQTELGGR